MARHVFLSFVVEDKSLVDLFRGQARNENNQLEFDDYSVREPFDSYNAEYIRSQIRNLISRSSVHVCLIGYSTYTSKWVDWEIRTSKSLGKGLFGIRLRNVNDVVPQALVDNNARIVNWNIADIVSTIEFEAKRAGY